MSHKLGLHWIRVHPDGQDYDHIARMQYRSAKLFEWHWNNRDACRDLLAALPSDAYVLARDHPLSEQKQDMWNDPIGTGLRHANEWALKVASGNVHTPVERTFFLGINEPDATNGDRASIDLYTATFLERLTLHGLRGGAFNFSTGHPRTVDGTAHTLADYTVFERSHQAIVRGHHIGVLHIYGSASTPLAPGHFDRLRACPWQDVEWVVGEFGLDEHVTTGGAHDGYLRAMADNPARYCEWLDKAIIGVNDARIHSYQVFSYDFSHPWDSFDIRAIRPALEGYDWQHAKQAPRPVDTHLPIIGNGPTPVEPPGDTWQRSREFVRRWEGNYTDDPNDHGNWTGGKKGVGELKGTKFGISAASYPHLDIRNITMQQADDIYFREYWQASGADKLQWPYCLLAFDTAVLHGVGTSRQWQQDVGNNAYAFAAKRLKVYTRLDNWHYFGAGWTNRTAELLEEASK